MLNPVLISRDMKRAYVKANPTPTSIVGPLRKYFGVKFHTERVSSLGNMKIEPEDAREKTIRRGGSASN